MPISICPQSTQLAITIWDVSPVGGPGAQGHAIPFGGTTIPLFDTDDVLQKGRQKCKVWRHKRADGLSPTTTPAVPPVKRHRQPNGVLESPAPDEIEEELERIEKMIKMHESEEVERVDWLDNMFFASISRRTRELQNLQRQRRKRQAKQTDPEGSAADQRPPTGNEENRDSLDEDKFDLIIEFPKFDFPVVFTDFEYTPTPISTIPLHSASGNVNLKPPPEVLYGPGIRGTNEGPENEDEEENYPLITIYDPEVGQKDNPAESKHRRLVRSQRTGILDRDLRPNAKIRDELNTIVAYGPTHELNGEEKNLIWKFRHHLTRDKRALTKFIKSVAWQDQSEVRQALGILPKWTEIDVDDALELLGPTFDNPTVRRYAVNRLRKAEDEELLTYLLQLVQALKFERVSTAENGEAMPDSSLASFLISRATQNFVLGNYLHWYLMVECDDRSLNQAKNHRKLFFKVEYDFMTALEATPGGSEQRKQLLRQAELITILGKVSKELQSIGPGNRPRMIEHLKKFLADPKNELLTLDPPLPLPLDPDVLITGCYPDESMVFKSSLSPMLIHFRTVTNAHYPVIFKTGDDLRQDQLVIQIISLMDRLLRKENLDLKLSPYRILATNSTAGAVQFVPSISLQAAKTKYTKLASGSNYILEYLRANSPDKAAEFGVRRSAMENYVKSCAGYCVVTYLLGVGDRHLDNLLLAPDGHFFHADFGYILGRDPKPAPPPIKITREMVDGMGGVKSANFAAFQQYCFTAYTTLRKSSSLILNLFALMTDANIPDIRAEPDKVVEKVRERFALGLSEEEAIKGFGALIEDSLSRLVPYIMDWTHDLVQRYTR
jgi:phosphatidylinositol 3-kinase